MNIRNVPRDVERHDGIIVLDENNEPIPIWDEGEDNMQFEDDLDLQNAGPSGGTPLTPPGYENAQQAGGGPLVPPAYNVGLQISRSEEAEQRPREGQGPQLRRPGRTGAVRRW